MPSLDLEREDQTPARPRRRKAIVTISRRGPQSDASDMDKHLYHFSEDPTIEVFVPRVAPTQQVVGAYVWADAEETSPRYWFPRNCPRGTWWRRDGTSRVHAIQWDWFDRFLACELYAYRFDAAPFRTHPGGGGWITTETVLPLGVDAVGPLLVKHRDASIELRLVNDLWALWSEVIEMPGISSAGSA
jgi:hypothetical protein